MSGMSKVFRPSGLCGLAALVALAVAGCAQGAPRQLPATPANISQVLGSARDGDTVVLAKGVYSQVKMPKRTFARPLVIDATAATIVGLYAKEVDGIEIRGGRFELPPPTTNPKNGKTGYHQSLRFDRSRNIRILGSTLVGPGVRPDASGEGIGLLLFESQNVEVADSHFSGFKTAVSMGRITGFKLLRNTFTAMRSDGINIGESRSGLIEGNECRDTRRRGVEHADCIQLFSRPTSPPTADVVIRKNRVEGMTQGIGMFNHARNGVDDGGFDRILIEENDIHVGFPNGIGLTDARASIVRNNRVQTYPGAEYRASISVRGDGDVKQCGNVVAAGVGKRGAKDPPC